MNCPKVSVIIPSYNSSETIRRALNSVLTQTYSDIEVIIVDDCSMDDTVEILKNYRNMDPRVKLLSTDINGGPGVARNVALKQARGEYIAFLDSDDFWLPEKLERQLKSFDDPKVIISYTNVILLNFRNKIQGILTARRRVGSLEMHFTNRITASSAMFPKKLTGATTMPAMRSGQDYAFWLSLLKNNPGHISGISDPLTVYVNTRGSVSSNLPRNIRKIFQIFSPKTKPRIFLSFMLVITHSFLKICRYAVSRMNWTLYKRSRKEKLQSAILNAMESGCSELIIDGFQREQRRATTDKVETSNNRGI